MKWCQNETKLFLMEHTEWIDGLIAPDSRRTASQKMGRGPGAIATQLNRGGLTMEMVVALARTYDSSPVDGLISTGYLEPHEVGVGMRITVSAMTNEQISDILAAISEEVMSRSMDDNSLRGQDDLAARRSIDPTPDVLHDWQDHAVADHSPDHPEEDTDFD